MKKAYIDVTREELIELTATWDLYIDYVQNETSISKDAEMRLFQFRAKLLDELKFLNEEEKK